MKHATDDTNTTTTTKDTTMTTTTNDTWTCPANRYAIVELDDTTVGTTFHLILAALVNAGDVATDALESFEDEGLARAELATLNLKHADALAVELVTEGIKAAGCDRGSMAEVFAVEAVGYVQPLADEFIFGADLDAVKAGGSAAEALAEAAMSWLTGCMIGGLDDVLTQRKRSNPRRS